MRRRPANLVSLTAMLLVSLISTIQFIAAAEYGPGDTNSEAKNSRTKNAAPTSKAASTEARTVKETVERALPYLERAGATWIEKRQCVSCHQVPFMLWSLSAAEMRGYPINQSSLRKWTAWSTEVQNFVKPAQKPNVKVAPTLAANIDTLNALLLGIPYSPQIVADRTSVLAAKNKDSTKPDTVEKRKPAAWRQQFVEALVKNQQAQGGWKPCGQLPAQKRSLEETTQVTTAWTLLALYSQQTTADREQQALAALQNTNPLSTEWWVVHLLLAKQRRDMNASALCDALIKKQQPDGGWGWLTSDPSDALATGMAIYALSRHDADQNKVAISKAVTFLATSQASDGSWQVPGTKKTTRNKPTPTSNYWGTAWAVIGLLESES
ncbi:MAG TPA: squalene--hopene cyclase [Rhodopirellula sp.]|nr:squalene--hopene cyclase [Rhodopirellula sp.]